MTDGLWQPVHILSLTQASNKVLSDETGCFCSLMLVDNEYYSCTVGAGIEGGFDVGEKKYDIEELCSVLVLPGWHEFPLSLPGLPEKVVCFYTENLFCSKFE